MADVIPTNITKVLAKIIIYILFTMMFCGVMGELLRGKMISKIQLIGNKEVTLLVKLNR